MPASSGAAESGLGAANGPWGSWTARSIQAVRSLLIRLAGMPDYAAYLAHLRRCHPESPVPSEREFYEQFVQSRYGDGTSRCC